VLTAEQRLALAVRAQELTYPSGLDVVVQGEIGDDFYIVAEGEAEAIDESGPTVLQRYGPGGSFGAYAVVYRALRAATVRAITDVRLLRIDRPTFDAFLAPRFILQERLAALVDERRMLKGVPLLRTLREHDLDLLLPRLVAERYDPGRMIIRQGERGEHFYIVKSGTVEVIDESQSPPRRLNVLGSGDYFGEIALLLDLPRVATVRALVEVTIWRLSRADFDLVLARYLGLDRLLAGTGEARLVANRAAGA
jgi:CRP-like cAMP-binding protein